METGSKKIDRRYPFNDACQWFIDHADIILLGKHIFVLLKAILICLKCEFGILLHHNMTSLFNKLKHTNKPLFFSVCPAGFVFLPGDIPGWGQIGSNPSTEATISDCSDRCNSEPNCCSFEYSATEKKCNLNRDCQPTQDVYKDYSFCSKGIF